MSSVYSLGLKSKPKKSSLSAALSQTLLALVGEDTNFDWTPIQSLISQAQGHAGVVSHPEELHERRQLLDGKSRPRRFYI